MDIEAFGFGAVAQTQRVIGQDRTDRRYDPKKAANQIAARGVGHDSVVSERDQYSESYAEQCLTSRDRIIENVWPSARLGVGFAGLTRVAHARSCG